MDCTLSWLKDIAGFEMQDLLTLQSLNERRVTTRCRGSASALGILDSCEECWRQGDTLVVILAIKAFSLAAFAGNVRVQALLHLSLILLLFITVLMIAEVAGALLAIIDEYTNTIVSAALVHICEIAVIVVAGNCLHIFFFFVVFYCRDFCF